MIVTIEIDTDKEPGLAEIHINAVKTLGVLHDFDSWLRDQIRYVGREDLEFVREALLEASDGLDLWT